MEKEAPEETEKAEEAPAEEDTGADETSAEKDSTEKNQEEPPKKESPPVKVVFQVIDGIVHQKEVSTGISSDTEWEIKSGLEEDVEIVSGPYRILSKQLNDGDEVTVDNSMKREMRDED